MHKMTGTKYDCRCWEVDPYTTTPTENKMMDETVGVVEAKQYVMDGYVIMTDATYPGIDGVRCRFSTIWNNSQDESHATALSESEAEYVRKWMDSIDLSAFVKSPPPPDDVYEWEERYMEMAKLVSTWSKDPSTQVGAVAVSRETGQILSQGYNGFPRGVEDLPSRYENKEVKYNMIVHAEQNLIYNASLTGVSLKDSTAYVYGLPVCCDCAKGIIQSGITTVYMRMPSNLCGNWLKSFVVSATMFSEAGVYWEFI